MINIKINKNFNLNKIDIWKIMKIWLYNSSEEAIEVAREFAPYQTWKLKQSIGRMPANINENTRKVVVWPRKVEYAQLREFVNRKNPNKRFYMKKTFYRLPFIVKTEFNKAIEIILKKYV